MKPESVSTKQRRIAELARNNSKMVITTLGHHMDYEWISEAYRQTRKNGAPGIDEMTAEKYEQNLRENLESLLLRLKSGTYRAPAVRRTYIPKGDGSKRPLGIPTFEDKIAQRAVVMLLEPVYEEDFRDSSFGFRPGRSAHQALRTLRSRIMDENGRWIFEVDISKYFDTINHLQLRAFLDKRVTDGVVRRLIDKWLKAGVLEDGVLRRSEQGTPQGGVISPLLANVYLHYVLDEWFDDIVRPRLKGKCSLIRYCDDFVMAFDTYADCQRVKEVLAKRLGKYGLSLHKEKTRIIDFRFKRPVVSHACMVTTFNFLGFTHLWVKSRKGKWVVMQRTAKDRLAKSLKRISAVCRQMMHHSIKAQHRRLRAIMLGFYAYYGITGNGQQVKRFAHRVPYIWYKRLKRRGGKRKFLWNNFQPILDRNPLPKPQIMHQYTHA